MVLTPKQQSFTDFIQNFTFKNGYSPSYTEIAEGLSIKSVGTVSWYVKTLEEKGILKRIYGNNGKRALSVCNQKNKERQYFATANVSSFQPIPLYSFVSAGFPSPAEDYMELALDLNEHLIKHPSATFYVYARGDSMIEAGIYDGDMLIVDRSLEVDNDSIVVAVINGEFTVKSIARMNDDFYLMPQNKSYQPIKITEDMDFEIWGVVTHSIHSVS